MSSCVRKAAPQQGHCDPGKTILFAAGTLMMTTFKKDPTKRPRKNKVTCNPRYPTANPASAGFAASTITVWASKSLMSRLH